MKIVMIHGQNHQGSSYHIGRILAEKLVTEQEITEFFLPKDLNHHCLGCYTCLENEEKCPFYAKKNNSKRNGIAVQASNWSEVKDIKKEKIRKDMSVLAKKIEYARLGKPSPYIRFLFSMMASTRKKNPDYMEYESVYWKENGWLDGEKPWKYNINLL